MCTNTHTQMSTCTTLHQKREESALGSLLVQGSKMKVASQRKIPKD